MLFESLMLEYMVLLAVDDGMLEKTVCAEEGGPATMLPAPDDERVDASVRTVLCAEEDAATSVLFGLVEFEYPDFGREDPGGGEYPILFLESLILEYMVLLTVDDGMFAKTVWAEDGGPATIYSFLKSATWLVPSSP